MTFPTTQFRRWFDCYDTAFQNAEGRKYKAGVYEHRYTEGEDPVTHEPKRIPDDTWICSVVKVLYVVRTESGKEHSYRIKYVEHGKTSPQYVILPQSSLVGRVDEALKTLRGFGVSVLNRHSKRVLEYLDGEHLKFSGEKPEDFWRSVKTVGWSPAPHCFVLPDELIGQQSRVCFVGHGDVAAYGKRGELAEWQSHPHL